MNTNELSDNEKRHAIKSTFYAVSRFFYNTSIGSGRLNKELIRLSVWHIEYTVDMYFGVFGNRYSCVSNELRITRETIYRINPDEPVIALIDSTIAIIDETKTGHLDYFLGDLH